MTTTQPKKRQADNMHFGEGYYRDTGCSVSKSCFECPLPQCRYDVPGGARIMVNEARNERIRDMHATGCPPGLLALEFGLTRRTVFRVLEKPA